MMRQRKAVSGRQLKKLNISCQAFFSSAARLRPGKNIGRSFVKTTSVK
jgi:hypothetical protein